MDKKSDEADKGGEGRASEGEDELGDASKSLASAGAPDKRTSFSAPNIRLVMEEDLGRRALRTVSDPISSVYTLTSNPAYTEGPQIFIRDACDKGLCSPTSSEGRATYLW